MHFLNLGLSEGVVDSIPRRQSLNPKGPPLAWVGDSLIEPKSHLRVYAFCFALSKIRDRDNHGYTRQALFAVFDPHGCGPCLRTADMEPGPPCLPRFKLSLQPNRGDEHRGEQESEYDSNSR